MVKISGAILAETKLNRSITGLLSVFNLPIGTGIPKGKDVEHSLPTLSRSQSVSQKSCGTTFRKADIALSES